MGFLRGVLGGGLGFAAAMLTNATKKVPMSRKPWTHAFSATIGFYLGYKYDVWEIDYVKEINELRAERGMLPMMASTGWLRFKEPDASQ
mmetsp:Transcript_40274/g.45829  ORF Transcript_40274/g.45829 Transcript_40274/m.45829 type:complete len:89 (-) Transcript_40274:260-526(-)